MRYVPVLVQLGLLVYCLIDCIQSDDTRVRNLPKLVWVFLIVIVPIVGGIAWLVAGRPLGSTARTVPWPATRTAGFPEHERPRGPDDDPTFLAQLDAPGTTHEQLLSQWEADLRGREELLRGPDGGSTGHGTLGDAKDGSAPESDGTEPTDGTDRP